MASPPTTAARGPNRLPAHSTTTLSYSDCTTDRKTSSPAVQVPVEPAIYAVTIFMWKMQSGEVCRIIIRTTQATPPKAKYVCAVVHWFANFTDCICINLNGTFSPKSQIIGSLA